MLCQHNPHRRCQVNFDKKYLVNDILKAKCNAPIRVEVIDRATGNPPEESIPNVVLHVSGRNVWILADCCNRMGSAPLSFSFFELMHLYVRLYCFLSQLVVSTAAPVI